MKKNIIKSCVVVMMFVSSSLSYCGNIHVPENVLQSDHSSFDQIQQLNQRMDALQRSLDRLDPSTIKSWLIWSGKWTVAVGGVSLVSYFAFRHVFDVASSQDCQDAYNRVRQNRQQNNSSLDAHTKKEMNSMQNAVKQAFDKLEEEQQAVFAQYSGGVAANVNTLNSKLFSFQNKLQEAQKALPQLVLDYGNHNQESLRGLEAGLKAQADKLENALGSEASEQQQQLLALRYAAQRQSGNLLGSSGHQLALTDN